MNELGMIQIELQKDRAYELSEWIELGLFNSIRNNSEIDSIYWVQNWLNVIKELRGGGL